MTKLPITDLDAYVSKGRYVGHQLLFARRVTVFPQQIADDGQILLGTQAARVVFGYQRRYRLKEIPYCEARPSQSEPTTLNSLMLWHTAHTC